MTNNTLKFNQFQPIKPFNPTTNSKPTMRNVQFNFKQVSVPVLSNFIKNNADKFYTKEGEKLSNINDFNFDNIAYYLTLKLRDVSVEYANTMYKCLDKPVIDIGFVSIDNVSWLYDGERLYTNGSPIARLSFELIDTYK